MTAQVSSATCRQKTRTFAAAGTWRRLACADFDDDGAPDLLVTTVGGRARLYRNVAPQPGPLAEGEGVRSQAEARRLRRRGAQFRPATANGCAVVSPSESYLCSSLPTALFGLGKETQFDSILVNWPDGARELFPGGTADQAIELRKGEGRAP